VPLQSPLEADSAPCRRPSRRSVTHYCHWLLQIYTRARDMSVPSIRTEARSVRSMRWKGVGSTCGSWRTTTHTLSTATNAVRTSPSSEFFNLVRSSNVITKNTTCSTKNITRVTELRRPRFSNVVVMGRYFRIGRSRFRVETTSVRTCTFYFRFELQRIFYSEVGIKVSVCSFNDRDSKQGSRA
jgi:hypothetical protein